VASSTKMYVSENVTTEMEPTKVTLGHLKATQTTVDYEVTVTGNRDVATAYLKDPSSGKVLYSKDLKVGVNSAIIEKLEVNHTYQFIVSSKKETFISQNITTDPTQTEVVINSLTVVNDTIDYKVTVTGSSDTVTAYLYDNDGKELYSALLSIGSNTGVIRDLEYGSTYRFVVSSATKTYAEASVTIEDNPTEVVLNDLLSNDNTISYDVTVVGTSVVLTAYLYDEDGTELYSKVLEEGTNTGDIEDLEYQQTYQFTISSEESIYINETISTEAGTTKVTVEKMEGYANTIQYSVFVEGKAKSLVLVVTDVEETEEEYARISLKAGDNSGAIDLDYYSRYLVSIDDDDDHYYDDKIDTDGEYEVYAWAEGNIVHYEAKIFIDLSLTKIALYDYETSDPTFIMEDQPLEAVYTSYFDKKDLSYNHTYVVYIMYDGEQIWYCDVHTEDYVNLNVEGVRYHAAVEYTYSFYETDYSDMEIAIYEDSQFKNRMGSTPVTGSEGSGVFELEGMNFCRYYYVTVEKDGEILKSDYADTDTIGSVYFEAGWNEVTCNATLFILDYQYVTMCLYSDEECKQPVSDEIQFTGLEFSHTFKNLEYEHRYYCGILWKGDVSTSPWVDTKDAPVEVTVDYTITGDRMVFEAYVPETYGKNLSIAIITTSGMPVGDPISLTKGTTNDSFQDLGYESERVISVSDERHQYYKQTITTGGMYDCELTLEDVVLHYEISVNYSFDEAFIRLYEYSGGEESQEPDFEEDILSSYLTVNGDIGDGQEHLGRGTTYHVKLAIDNMEEILIDTITVEEV